MMESITFHCGSLYFGGKPKVLINYSQHGIRVCNGFHIRNHGKREMDNQLYHSTQFKMLKNYLCPFSEMGK